MPAAEHTATAHPPKPLRLTPRLWLLATIAAVGFSAFYLLPKTFPEQPYGVNLDLPEYIGEWWGHPSEVSQRERDILGPDTTFVRKIYINGAGDEVMVSIVLSGQDMSRSIHRPERCLPAQGWTMIDSRRAAVALDGPPPQILKVTRLHNFRPVEIPDRPEEKFRVYSLNYYWFAGLTDITPSHFTRMFIDNRDRLLRGYNQRWAYITIVSTITEGLKPFGKNERDTGRMIEGFIKEIAPIIHGPTLKAKTS